MSGYPPAQRGVGQAERFKRALAPESCSRYDWLQVSEGACKEPDECCTADKPDCACGTCTKLDPFILIKCAPDAPTTCCPPCPPVRCSNDSACAVCLVCEVACSKQASVTGSAGEIAGDWARTVVCTCLEKADRVSEVMWRCVCAES